MKLLVIVTLAAALAASATAAPKQGNKAQAEKRLMAHGLKG